MIIREILEDWSCPKCGRRYEGRFFSTPDIKYVPYNERWGEKEYMKVTCTNCGYSFNAEPLDKNV